MYLVNEVVTEEKQDEIILRIVKEWLKGCSCAETKPSDCKECTDGMIEAIERKILKDI